MEDRSTSVVVDIKLVSCVAAVVVLVMGLSFWWTYGDQVVKLFH